LFDLEYFRNKLATKAKSIVTLEQSVMSGMPFWEQKEPEIAVDVYDQSDEDDNDGKPKQPKP
jgi:hypothetical protein